MDIQDKMQRNKSEDEISRIYETFECKICLEEVETIVSFIYSNVQAIPRLGHVSKLCVDGSRTLISSTNYQRS